MKNSFKCSKCKHQARTVFKVKMAVTARYLLTHNYFMSFDFPRILSQLDKEDLVGFYCKRCGQKYHTRSFKKFLRAKRLYLKLTKTSGTY